MHDLFLLTTLFALLYGLTWHDQPARERESEEGSGHQRNAAVD